MMAKTLSFRALPVLSLVLSLGVFVWVSPSAGAEPQTLTVVELFTSEGCSSCPPADEYLSDLADEKDLLALSLHVDYWDYIGWKDPFASPTMTARQRAYMRAMRLRYVYTPQMVVQGRWEGTGSNRWKIGRFIRTAKQEAKTKPPVPVALSFAGGGTSRLRITIDASQGQPENPTSLHLVVFERERVVKVKRGENRGRTLGHRNVVRSFTPIGTWKGAGYTNTVSIPVLVDHVQDERGTAPAKSAAVLIQDDKTMAILGAAVLPLGPAR